MMTNLYFVVVAFAPPDITAPGGVLFLGPLAIVPSMSCPPKSIDHSAAAKEYARSKRDREL
jgi:hypothetical protein